MATVYLAEDLKHRRKVAVKPDAVTDVAFRLVALSISSFHLTQCGNQLGYTVKPLTQVILR